MKKINFGCLGITLLIIMNVTCGGWSVNQILSWFNKDIPFFFDVIIGILAGFVTVPVALIGWILRFCGVF